MFSNYFKTARRSLWKNKLTSGINLGGLAVGIASCLLLLSYVAFQFSYDSFHVNKNNLYRVGLDYYQDGKLNMQTAENYAATGPALKNDFPEVADVARLYNMGYKNNCVFSTGEKHFRETKFMYADASFLTMFSFPFIEGNPATALTQPFTAVISASAAKQLFGNINPLGQTIQMDDDDRNAELCKITGVFKDVPENSHLKFNILISYLTLDARRNGAAHYENNWDKKDFYTYVLLRPGTDAQKLQSKLALFASRHLPSEKSHHTESRMLLEPLQKIHLAPARLDQPEETANEKAVVFLIIIAVFIICIAWVNYINLSIAASMGRAKEIGIRKVLGSRRIQLIQQFLTEAFSLNIAGVVVALLLIYALEPLLNRFFGTSFPLTILLTSGPGWWFLFFLLAGTVFSGLYPALVLSSFKPVTVLKGKLKASANGIFLRKSLVIFQFSLSIFLIIGTMVVYQQVHYMLSQNIGMNTSQVMVLDRPGKWDTARSSHNSLVEHFKTRLENNSNIESIGMSDEIPGKEIRWPSNYTVRNRESENPISINTTSVNEHYLPALGIKLLAGRNFSRDYATDGNGILLTASAARMLGFKSPQDAVDKELKSDNSIYTILGVTNDIHQESLARQMQPAAFQFNSKDMREFEYYLVKIKSSNIPAGISAVQEAWKASFKDNPFNYYFLDNYFDRQYKNNIQFGFIFGAFSIIAICIACIGLFALLAFMIEQRTKEIGVRKVLGAGLWDIVALLTKDFVQLVFFANIIAWPLGWLLMNNWLQDFAYRIHVSWLLFIIAGAAAFMIAFITIGTQAFKTAVSNPVKSLRTE